MQNPPAPFGITPQCYSEGEGCQGSCSLSFPWGNPAAQELFRALHWLHNQVLLPCPNPALPKKSTATSAEQAAKWDLCYAGARMLEQWRWQCGTWVRSAAALIFFPKEEENSLWNGVFFLKRILKYSIISVSSAATVALVPSSDEKHIPVQLICC